MQILNAVTRPGIFVGPKFSSMKPKSSIFLPTLVPESSALACSRWTLVWVYYIGKWKLNGQ